MRRSSRWFAVIVPLLIASCRENDTTLEGSSPSASSAGVPAAPQFSLSRRETVLDEPLFDRTSFDLTLVAAEPLLGWTRDGRNVRLSTYPDRGERRGPYFVSTEAPVVELALRAAGDRVALAYVDRDGAWATHGALADLSVPVRLGSASVASRERGHIAVASVMRGPESAGSERFVVFHRGGREPCREAPSGCVDFPLYELDETPIRRRVVLSVPAPCGRSVAGFVAADGRWYYGVCALRNGRAATTMFTIERSPDYAQAESLLEGCVPLGPAILGDRVLLVGRCGTERRAVRIGRRESPVEAVGLAGVSVTCEDDRRLRLRATGPSALDHVLDEPAEDIAAVLPEPLAPADSRAVWTGKSLVIASSVGSRLLVRRYSCVPN